MNEVLDERDDAFVQHKFGVGANARTAFAYAGTYALGATALLCLSTHPVAIGHVVLIKDDAVLVHALALASMYFVGLFMLAIDDQGGFLTACEALIVSEAICCAGAIFGVCPQAAYACIALTALAALIGVAKVSVCALGKRASAVESFFVPAWWVAFCLAWAVNVAYAVCEVAFKLHLC